MHALTNLFTNYSLALDQRFTISKSTMYVGEMSSRHIRKIKAQWVFVRLVTAHLPWITNIFKGMVKALVLQPLTKTLLQGSLVGKVLSCLWRDES